MSDEGENHRACFPPRCGGLSAAALALFRHPPPSPLSAHKPLRGLRLVVGEKCELGERGWKLHRGQGQCGVGQDGSRRPPSPCTLNLVSCPRTSRPRASPFTLLTLPTSFLSNLLQPGQGCSQELTPEHLQPWDSPRVGSSSHCGLRDWWALNLPLTFSLPGRQRAALPHSLLDGKWCTLPSFLSQSH